jgi:hypothetical protein
VVDLPSVSACFGELPHKDKILIDVEIEPTLAAKVGESDNKGMKKVASLNPEDDGDGGHEVKTEKKRSTAD